MAYCEAYGKLENDEQAEFLAKLIYLVQTDPTAFDIASGVINYGQVKGLYSRVKFGRDALLNEVPVLTDQTKD
jgi:hypothetical protein